MPALGQEARHYSSINPGSVSRSAPAAGAAAGVPARSVWRMQSTRFHAAALACTAARDKSVHMREAPNVPHADAVRYTALPATLAQAVHD